MGHQLEALRSIRNPARARDRLIVEHVFGRRQQCAVKVHDEPCRTAPDGWNYPLHSLRDVDSITGKSERDTDKPFWELSPASNCGHVNGFAGRPELRPKHMQRARKVKCDETKPACLRCVKTGRKCDGYTPVAPPSSRPGLAISPAATPDFESPEERRAFDYYRTRSAPLIGSAMDLDFWAGLVVKLSVREPVVRHAMLALSSIHESLSTGGPDAISFQRSFAFAEYGKAISSMRQWDSQRSSEAIPLLVCLLFVCIEFLLGDEPSSQLHICQGREILFRLEQSQSPDMALVKRYLAPVYMRLSLPGFFRASRPAPMPTHLINTTAVPQEFGTIDEARSLLYYLMDETLRITVQGKPALYDPNLTAETWEALKTTQQRLSAQLSRWNISFTMLVATMPASQSQAVADMQHLLHILYESTMVWIGTALQTTELAYDAYVPSFAAIISHATALIHTSMSLSNPKLFTFETELIAPLYWTVVKCRHPLLRRTALRLLQKDEMRHRRENIWSTETTIAVALRVIELEEQGQADNPVAGVDWERFFEQAGDSLNITPGDQFDNLGFQAVPTSQPLQPHHQHEVYEGELTVPTTRPPTLDVPSLDVVEWESDDGLGALPSIKNHISPLLSKSQQPRPFVPPPIHPSPPMAVNLEAMGVESPYGVPEDARIKNTMIGPVQDGGVWSTMFRSGKDGTGTWDVTREFLKL
ncbi:Transcription regulator lscL [Paramyrothecium foliicola]|nr:Transcription regulator lscL [Paramyrothecium foliicola]